MYIEAVIQKQVEIDPGITDDSEHETSEDEQDTMSLEEITQKIKIVDIFETAPGFDHVNMITTCWCAGLRVHKSCAQKLDLPDDTPLCIFDGGSCGVCTSDGISCVPCIVCHKVKDSDTRISLLRDFPIGDNWIFREERACPCCIGRIRKDWDETHCEFCKVDYDENAVSM